MSVVTAAVEGRKWAEAWQTAKRIKYGSTTKAVSQGRWSHKSPSPPPSPSPSPPPRHPPCTSNLLLPRQRPATKTAPDTTKNKTADRCRYCHAECALLPPPFIFSSFSPSGGGGGGGGDPATSDNADKKKANRLESTGEKKTLFLN